MATPARAGKYARIDQSHAAHARSVCDFVLGRMDARGRYVPEEALFFESHAYRSSLAGYLAAAGKLLGEKRYVTAAGRMLRGVLEDRRDGLWPVGCWVEFPIYRPVPVDWREQYLGKPDLRTSGITAAMLAVYHRASGDDSVVEPARRALERMLDTWNFESERKTILHVSFEALGIAIALWRHALPEFSPRLEPILHWVLDTFVDNARADFPFGTMYRTMFVLGVTKTRHIESHIRPGIEAMLAEPRWRCPQNRDDFFHIASTADHVNIRANGAVAVTLRLLDIATGDPAYTTTPVYRHVASWVDGLRRDDGGYYGCQEHGRGARYCLGSPSQYIPLCWHIGGLVIDA
jgi:hypothetical protein